MLEMDEEYEGNVEVHVIFVQSLFLQISSLLYLVMEFMFLNLLLACRLLGRIFLLSQQIPGGPSVLSLMLVL